MKFISTTALLLIALTSFSQIRPICKVYIVEGIVADRETLAIVPSAILYNDSLKLATTSDERGYYKIVVPYNFIKTRRHIYFDVIKTGFKRNGWGISFNPANSDTSNSQMSGDTTITWNYDVQVLLLAKSTSTLESTSMAHAPEVDGVHGYAAIKQVYDDVVSSAVRDKKFTEMKDGNDRVYFPLDGEIGLATNKYDIIVVGRLRHVFIDDKKVELAEINQVAKRSEINYDKVKSQLLTEKYGKETLAFITIPKSQRMTRESSSLKLTLIIHVDD